GATCAASDAHTSRVFSSSSAKADVTPKSRPIAMMTHTTWRTRIAARCHVVTACWTASGVFRPLPVTETRDFLRECMDFSYSGFRFPGQDAVCRRDDRTTRLRLQRARSNERLREERDLFDMPARHRGIALVLGPAGRDHRAHQPLPLRVGQYLRVQQP